MHNSIPSRTICLAFILVISGACDTGSKSETPADIAADSALRADLALANRDTLLVDSIGRDPGVHGALADTGTGEPAGLKPNSTASATVPALKAGNSAPVPAPAPVAPPTIPKRVTIAPASPRPKTNTPRVAAAPPARTTTGRPCDSPVLDDQKACVRTTLALADKRLNGIYRALIVEMRRKANFGPGQGDPPPVAQLRKVQRAFLVSRDVECRRRGRGKEGALWAYPRVHCLGQMADQRATELADEFSHLTAH